MSRRIRARSQIFALATNTFREAIRDRILYSLLFFAGLLLLVALALQEFTIGDQDKVVRSAALGAIRLFGSVISIFLGIGLVYKEIERKTIYTIASKPLSRWIFVLGKYLGLSKERVRQIEIKALKKLRSIMKPREMELLA